MTDALHSLGLAARAALRGDAPAAREHAQAATGHGNALDRLAAAHLLDALGDVHGAHDAFIAAYDPASPLAVRLAVLSAHAALARRAGWFHVASSRLELAQTLAPADTRWPAAIANLWSRAGVPSRALEALAPGEHSAAPVALLAAELLLASDRRDEACATLSRVLAAAGNDVALKLRMAPRLAQAGMLEELEAIHAGVASPDAAVWGWRARFALWRGRTDDAERLARAALALDPGSTDAARVLAIRDLLDGRTEDARAAFVALLERHPRDGEAMLWLSELELRARHFDEAAMLARRAGESLPDATSHLATVLTAELAQMRVDVRALRRAIGVGGLRPDAPETLAVGLAALVPESPRLVLRASSEELAIGLERALTRLGANRGVPATYVREDGSLAALLLPTSVRERAKRISWRLGLVPDAEVLSALDELAAEYPGSSHVPCYRGEVNLWLGRYDEARTDFDRAIAILANTRWAYIGLAAAALGLGDAASALELCASPHVLAGSPGPTMFAYRGEAYLRLGRLAEARADFERAIAHAPGRVSSALGLALVHLADVQPDAARAVLREAAPRMHALLADLGRALDLPIAWAGVEAVPASRLADMCETALAWMRGNRASSHVTYVLPDGERRVLGRGDGDGSGPAGHLRAVSERLVRAEVRGALVLADIDGYGRT